MSQSPSLPPLVSTDPTDGSSIESYPQHSDAEIDDILARAVDAQKSWDAAGFAHRAEILRSVATTLRERQDDLAVLMADEMGKPLSQGRAEAEKCAWVCEYYAEHAAEFLADVERSSDHSGAWTVYRPLGTVLAVMPWNFPLWQVFRFAAPTLMAGNTGVLKHASNVSGCAVEIERMFREAGADGGEFSTLLIASDRVEKVIADPRVAAVTLTGSEPAGRSVAAAAGQHLKPSVLELGGSDPYLILADADLDLAAEVCARSRLINSGQSCIAAKRFIAVAEVHDRFVELFVEHLDAYVVGDPKGESTTVGPQARRDLRDDLHQQVRESVTCGATLILGGENPEGDGAYYPVSVLVDVEPGMPAFDDELFGPVAAVVRADDVDSAIELANASSFGLGAAVFTGDEQTGRRIAADRLEAGCCFVNGLVASDPRLPFGGIKISGYGRELADLGIHEFVNAKTVAIASA